MRSDAAPARPRAKILGPGLTVTVEEPVRRARTRLRVLSRAGRSVELEPIPGGGTMPDWEPGSSVSLRVPRPFGMFRYRATVVASQDAGICRLTLAEGAPKRQQLRDYFRMPVRLSVRLTLPDNGSTGRILQARDLSAGGILVLDPDRSLALADSVGLGLPIGPGREIIRLTGRVVRVQSDPGRAALAFQAVPEGVRRAILRYLFREHRRKAKRGNRSHKRLARIRDIHERP